ncbi:MAG: VCBS repeat-containing protein [Verrucomicrobiales bacterium]|nr:VCBS repeat-containing protein [Verrucomicrobiales bacterium]
MFSLVRRRAFVQAGTIGALIVVVAGALVISGCGRQEGGATVGGSAEDEFQKLSVQGRSLYDSGEATRAVPVLERALALQPAHPDARLNLANALLRANNPTGAVMQAQELVRMNQNLAPAHFLLGAASLRLGQAEAAATALQVAKDADRTVNAVSYLLGRAHYDLGHFEDAVALFDEVLQFETNHPAANYNLSQALTRLGRTDEAARALESHRAVLAQRGGASVEPATLEACAHTEIRVPFRLEQPAREGVAVAFTEATAQFFGDTATRFSAPMAVIDIRHDGTNDLMVREGDASFRLLIQEAGRFQPARDAVAVSSNATYHKVLVGDLNRDRYEDIVVLGDRGLHAFRLATNGLMTDSTAFSNLRQQPAVDGMMADLDFTGNLDLVLVTPTNRSLRILRNLGNMYFTNATMSSGLPQDLAGVAALVTDDWNGDELNDLFLGTAGAAPRLFPKQRGGAFTNVPPTEAWPACTAFAVGDFNNDLRQDLVLAGGGQLTVILNGFEKHLTLPLSAPLHDFTLVDFDNDGWLDILGVSDTGCRAWRNLGEGGLKDVTVALGFDRLPPMRLVSVLAADLDSDCDTDLVLAVDGGGLRVLRNDGGSANRQVKLRLLGTRSNASGLGLRIELVAGNWRALRTVHQLPVEIGIGRHDKIDTLNVRWFDTMSTDVDTPVTRCEQLSLVELVRPTGSCPYLYRWDGEQFTFVTDLLGAAPVGLPVAERRYIEADPDELAWIGDERQFRPRNGAYAVQITEELREVLYLDEAKLVVVDHPMDVEVHPTDKLVPGRPFPPTDLAFLHHRQPLRGATNLAGQDVTRALQEIDQAMVSPLRLRPDQQRGYAEPHGMVMDFGPLDRSRPWVLALTGWLRFGGGMANMAASRDPSVPFPFPILEAETPQGWVPVDVTAGAPCGKTKTILVDLAGRLPEGTTRLRLTAGFEIHWDRAAMFERVPDTVAHQITRLAPDRTDLQWRGYSEFRDLPWTQPLTPDHGKVRAWPDWRITPSGWCTRYGAVDELIAQRDGGLALINGGDALTLEFEASRLPEKPAGQRRSFFLFTVGWDKDADFHVVQGDRVEPLPWEGMDDQQYGTQVRPPHPGDALNQRYNTRWVGPVAQLRKR